MQKLLSLISLADNGEASLGGIWCQGSEFGLDSIIVGVMEGSWAGGWYDQSSIPERWLGRQCEEQIVKCGTPSAALGNLRGKTSLRGDVSVSFGSLEVLTKENWSSGQRPGLWLYHCKSSTYTPSENGTTGKHVKKREGLAKAVAPHSSTRAWKIPGMEEPGGLQSMGSLRVGHDWATSLSLFTFTHWRRKWQPTPVFLPGVSQGWRSLVGCRLWGRTESATPEAT